MAINLGPTQPQDIQNRTLVHFLLNRYQVRHLVLRLQYHHVARFPHAPITPSDLSYERQVNVPAVDDQNGIAGLHGLGRDFRDRFFAFG